jgi:hypothetical protein
MRNEFFSKLCNIVAGREGGSLVAELYGEISIIHSSDT